MKNERVGWLVAAVAASALVVVGCENTARGAGKDARENTAAARESAREARVETAEATERAGERLESGTQTVGADIDAAKQTLDVKTALMADTTVDASEINVDTFADTKTVHLRGSVPSAEQKSAAERIAQSKAEGYTIKNELQIVRR